MGSPPNAAVNDDGLRIYTFNGQPLISATSSRRVVGMPFALSTWQVNQVITAANLMRGTLQDKTMNPDEYGKALRKLAMGERDAAAALGSSVHEAADLGVYSETLNEDDLRKPFLRQYEAWLRSDMQPEVLVSEQQVFHLKEGYAGSLDLIANLTIAGKRMRTLVDLKTGKGIYTDHAIQLALYMGAEFIGGYDPIEDLDVMFPTPTQHLMDCETMGVLHLRPDAWSFVEIPYTDRLAAAALDMVRLARFYMDNPDIETLKGATYP